jgi:hypothetical protein
LSYPSDIIIYTTEDYYAFQPTAQPTYGIDIYVQLDFETAAGTYSPVARTRGFDYLSGIIVPANVNFRFFYRSRQGRILIYKLGI